MLISKPELKFDAPCEQELSVSLSTQAIGIFDSGVGGLSITSCIQDALPNESLIYIADTLHAPYGDKSVEQIQNRVNVISDYLISQGVKAIVIACNTATVNAIEQLRARVDIPIIGVEPAIKPACSQSKQKKIGILVTQATAHNARFLALINDHKKDTEVFIQPCPGLVELIEQGRLTSPHIRELLSQYLAPLQAKEIDTLVLGCTHYPFVTDIIRELVGENITIMETAVAVTEQLQRQLQKYQLNTPLSLTDSPLAPLRLVSSLYSPELENVFKTLLNNNLKLEYAPL